MRFASEALHKDEVAVVMKVMAIREGTERQLWEFTLPQGVTLKQGEVIAVEFLDRRRRPR